MFRAFARANVAALCFVLVLPLNVADISACSSIADCNARQCLDCTCVSGQCACADGYTGANCEIPFCINRTDGCSGHGECNMTRTNITCACDEGYQGSRCESMPCNLKCERGSTPDMNNQSCTFCKNCPPGWNGTLCNEWSDANQALAAVKATVVDLQESVKAVATSVKQSAFCTNAYECVGWGVNYVTGEPLGLPFNNFGFGQNNSFLGILCPDDSNCIYHSGHLEPVFAEPSGAHVFPDVLAYASAFDQRRSNYIFQRGPIQIANNGTTLHTSMSPKQANDALFNVPPGDRAPTNAQATFFFVDMELSGAKDLTFNPNMMNLFRGLPPSYAAAPTIWDTIFDTIGTHIIVEGSMGGILEMQSYWKTELLQKNVTLSQLETQAKLAFTSETGLEWPAGTDPVDPYYTKNTNTLLNCLGGDDTLCPSSGNSTQDWVDSIPSNPMLVQYKVDRLSAFIKDPAVALLWDDAVEEYLKVKSTEWSETNKCPSTCTNSESGAVGTCDKDQTACVCPCHLGRTCNGPGACLDDVCCPGYPPKPGFWDYGSCNYHLSPDADHDDDNAQPNGDGDIELEYPQKYFPTVLSAQGQCDATWLGMHCDCHINFPLPTVEYGTSGWSFHIGCGGSCSKGASTTAHVKTNYSGAKTCQYPNLCSGPEPQSRDEFNHAISEQLSQEHLSLAHKFAEDAVERGLYPSIWQRPSNAFVPGVTSSFFPNITSTTPYVAELETAGVLQVIQEEVRRFNLLYEGTAEHERTTAFRNTVTGDGENSKLALPRISHQNARTNIEGSWGQVLLMNRNLAFTADAIQYFPRTVSVLQAAVKRSASQIEGMPPGGIVMARLPAGVKIRAHCGLTNARLRVSYGVIVPSSSSSSGGQPSVGIRVGNETRQWQEGHALLLDDSFEHDAWNNAATDRVVLLADFWHPGLSESKRQALSKGKFFYDERVSDRLFNGTAWETIRCKSSAKMWAQAAYNRK